MTWFHNLLAAVAASAVVSALAVVFMKALIEKGVQHTLDRQLEALKGQIRQDDERFKADLQTQQAQIGALRSGALSGLASRQAALDNRRAQAAERLWAETVELGRFRVLSMTVAALKIETLLDMAAGSGRDAAKVREFADTVLKASNINSPSDVALGNAPDKERLFVAPIAWAMFSAYRLMLTYPAMLLMMAKAGVEKGLLKGHSLTLQPIKDAMPEYSEFIDKFGLSSLGELVKPMEEKLLRALQDGLKGEDADAAAIERAASILKGVERADAALKSGTPGKTPPPGLGNQEAPALNP